MKSIKDNIENTIIIKNSKFITNIYRINNYIDIDNYINNIKDKYKDASHNCYGYIYENKRKCSDDGEPSGTAGNPILDVLDKNELSNVLVIVTRYFGGIKLGASGLIRAYSNCVCEVLKKCNIIDLINGYNIDIIFDYDIIKKIDYILNDVNIIYKEYKDKVKYNVNVNDDTLNLLNNIDNIKVIINSNVYLEKS